MQLKENLEINGNSLVKGNMKIEGMLEAPNLRGFLKGLYATESDLLKSIPSPRGGWAALVGTTLPADLYVVEDGVWVNTGRKAGSPVVTGSDHSLTLINEEAAARRLNDDMILDALRLVCDYRRLQPSWTAGRHIDLFGKLVESSSATEMNVSEPIYLKTGECIEVKCDTDGVAYPIAITDSTGKPLHIPIIGDCLDSGTRSYRFTAWADCYLCVSCKGSAEKIDVWRRLEQKLVTKLYSASGRVMYADSTGDGAMLRTSGDVLQTAGFAASDLIPVYGMRQLHLTTHFRLSEKTANAAVLVMYDSDSQPIEVYRPVVASEAVAYAGEEPDPHASISETKVPEGKIDLDVLIPTRAMYVRVGYSYLPATTAQPTFELKMKF